MVYISKQRFNSGSLTIFVTNKDKMWEIGLEDLQSLRNNYKIYTQNIYKYAFTLHNITTDVFFA